MASVISILITAQKGIASEGHGEDQNICIISFPLKDYWFCIHLAYFIRQVIFISDCPAVQYLKGTFFNQAHRAKLCPSLCLDSPPPNIQWVHMTRSGYLCSNQDKFNEWWVGICIASLIHLVYSILSAWLIWDRLNGWHRLNWWHIPCLRNRAKFRWHWIF